MKCKDMNIYKFGMRMVLRVWIQVAIGWKLFQFKPILYVYFYTCSIFCVLSVSLHADAVIFPGPNVSDNDVMFPSDGNGQYCHFNENKSCTVFWDSDGRSWCNLLLKKNIILPENIENEKLKLEFTILNDSTCTRIGFIFLDRDGERVLLRKELSSRSPGDYVLEFDLDILNPDAGFWGGEVENKKIDLPLQLYAFTIGFPKNSGDSSIQINRLILEGASQDSVVVESDEKPLGPEWNMLKDISYYEDLDPETGDRDYAVQRCEMDFYYPTHVENYPTVVFFHGGGLITGSKFLPEQWKRGIEDNTLKFAVVTPNYRLSGKNGTHAPDYFYDGAAAVAWVLNNVKNYGGDPDLVFVGGHSGGGYLAAMIGLDPQYLSKYNCSPDQLAGLLLYSACVSTHFAVQAEQKGEPPPMKPAEHTVVDSYAPIYHLSEKSPTILQFVGDPKLDWPARCEENELMYAIQRYKNHRDDGRFYSFSGFGHGYKDLLVPALSVTNKEVKRISEEMLVKKKEIH